MIEDLQHSNIAEEEMGQLHGSIDIHLNAIAQVQRSMQGSGRDYCADCGVKIALQRRLAMPSCLRCIVCQSAYERQ